MTVSKDKIKKYMDMLVEFQPDIKHIVLSLRRSNHHLSVEEIVGEINFRMVKFMERLIKSDENCLAAEGFKKLISSVSGNCVRWTAKGVLNREYKNFWRKIDNCQINENGDTVLSLNLNYATLEEFESAETEAKAAFKSFNILEWIENYSDFLTDNELIVFKNLRKGVTKGCIAKKMKVSHQMISLYEQTLFEKIQSNVKTNFCIYSESKKIKSSQDSINRLFSKK